MMLGSRWLSEYERTLLAVCYEKVRIALGWVKSSQTHEIEGSCHHFIWHGPIYSVRSLFSHDTLPETSEGPQKLTLPMHPLPPSFFMTWFFCLPLPPQQNKTLLVSVATAKVLRVLEQF